MHCCEAFPFAAMTLVMRACPDSLGFISIPRVTSGRRTTGRLSRQSNASRAVPSWTRPPFPTHAPRCDRRDHTARRQQRMNTAPITHGASTGQPLRWSDNRWLQLVVGIVCMIATANIQYAWTLFVPEIQEKFGWERASIQVAFTIFVLVQTWLAPIEGYFIDKFGPRLMVAFGAVFIGAAWVINSQATTLTGLLHRRGRRRHRRRLDLRNLHQQRAQVVPGPPRAGGGPDGRRLRRRLGGHHPADRGHDRVLGLPAGLHVLRPAAGFAGLRRGLVPARTQGRRSTGGTRPSSTRAGATTRWARRCAPSCSG